MPEFAPKSTVLKKETEINTAIDVPSNTSIDVVFDAEFPLVPEFNKFESDDGLTIKSLTMHKGKAVVKFNEVFHSGKKFKFRVEPKKMI